MGVSHDDVVPQPSRSVTGLRNISEVCAVSPDRAYVSSSRNFGRWSGWRRLVVPGSSAKTTGSWILASFRTKFCLRSTADRSVDTRL